MPVEFLIIGRPTPPAFWQGVMFWSLLDGESAIEDASDFESACTDLALCFIERTRHSTQNAPESHERTLRQGNVG